MKWTSLLATAVLGLTFGCTRAPSPTKDQLREDFDTLCRGQKEYLEARRNLKGAPEKELRAERTRRMREGLQTEAGLKAFETLTAAPTADPRGDTERTAQGAGLTGWGCPELAEYR